MIEDSVLRCKTATTLEGITMPQIWEVVPNGDFYNFIVQWGEHENGRTPKRWIQIPASQCRAINNPDFELVCVEIINLDVRQTIDVEGEPTRFFQDPP